MSKAYKLKDHQITIIRRIVQITAFTFINYVILELIFSVNLKTFEGLVKVLPILNSPRNPLSKGAGIMEYIFYFISQGEIPFLLLAILLLVLLFTNRFFCGWICPIGTIQDGLALLSNKNKRIKTNTHETLLKTKYLFIIVLLLVIVPLGVSKRTDPEFYKDYTENLGPWANKPVGYFSLSEYIFVYFPKLVTKMWEEASLLPLFSDFWTFFIFAFYLVIIILAVFYPRAYCKYLCPFAAIASTVGEYSFLKLSRSPVRCVGKARCGICERVCPKQVRVLDEPFEFFTGKGECNFCLKCKEACTYKAISIKFG